MRIIKFRAWDKATNTMKYQEDMDFLVLPWKNKPLWFENIELMQFTWLLDKNGKEIYEGDIIIFWSPDIKQIVEFREWQYMAKQIGTYWSYVWLGYCDWRNESEIIWNIYSNPELLTK
jgi:uncharacterized phage protein (TIGR01671 family)